jgi:acetyl-CoA C-acetyltransferase
VPILLHHLRRTPMSEREIIICNPVRTAIGTYGGSLKDTPAPDLGVAVIRETLNRSGLAMEDIDTVVMGNVIQAGTKMNPARQAAIGAGLPVRVPAMTVNRVCGSGAQAIASAALEILAGYASCAIAVCFLDARMPHATGKKEAVAAGEPLPP